MLIACVGCGVVVCMVVFCVLSVVVSYTTCCLVYDRVCVPCVVECVLCVVIGCAFYCVGMMVYEICCVVCSVRCVSYNV